MDQRLVLRVQGGDQRAFEALVVADQARLYRLAYGILRDLQLAERHNRNLECSPQAWTASDPRLTGDGSRRWNEDIYITDEEGFITVSMDAAYLRSDGSGWACSDSRLLSGSDMSTDAFTGGNFTCVGEDGYEGLSAILVLEETVGFNEEFVGLIFSGDFPPLPGRPAAD